MSNENLDPAQTLRVVSEKDIKKRRGKWAELLRNLEHLLSDVAGNEEWVEIKLNSDNERTNALGAIRQYFLLNYGAGAITTQKGSRENYPYIIYVARGDSWPNGSSE